MTKLVQLFTLAVYVSKSASQDCLVVDPPGISETGGGVLKIALEGLPQKYGPTERLFNEPSSFLRKSHHLSQIVALYMYKLHRQCAWGRNLIK